MNELSLKIFGQKFYFFNKFNLNLSYNSIASVFSFEGIIVNENQRKLFKPLSYHNVQVLFEDNVLLTGTSLNTSTSVENTKSMGNISGYSKTGVLEDCEIPVSLYPLQSNGLSLKQITEKLIKPFGIKLLVESSVSAAANKIYNVIIAEPDQKIKNYISELARQRNIIITHDNYGNLLFTRLKLKQKSVATYTEGMPATRISLSTNGQSLHSKITVLKQVTLDINSPGEQTVNNNLVNKFRPLVKKQTSGDNNDTSAGAEMLRAAELRNISLMIETDRWKWTDGKKIDIIKPNQIIEVHSPSNFINKRTRFFVEQVAYIGTNEGISATINCVLPETYNGKQPKNIFV